MLRWSWRLGWGGVGCSRSCYPDGVTLIMGVGVRWGGMLTYMRFRNVVRYKMQFSKLVKIRKLPKLTGTQCLDQAWNQLKKFVPKELRSWDLKSHRDNSRLTTYVWLSCSDGTQGRTCWKQLALVVQDQKTLIFGKVVCSSRRANGICDNEVQSHGRSGTFWTQVPSRPFNYMAKRRTESLRLISKWANYPGPLTRPQPCFRPYQ